MLRIAVIGELELELDGMPLAPLRSGRAKSLLAWMALHPGVHPRSRLAGLFWPDVLEESARTSLRTTLATLRRELGGAAPYVVASRTGAGIPPSPEVWTDVLAFDELVREGRLEDALELCRGDLVADLDDDWVYELRDRHRDRVVEVLARLARGAEDAGDLGSAIRWTREQVALDPLAEATHRHLIRLLDQAGDRSSALAAFDDLRARFRRDFRAEPSAATLVLAEEIRRGVARTVVDRPVDHRPSAIALPDFLSRPEPLPIVGRREQLDALREEWRRSTAGETRVVVVHGEAGSGKSRLVSELVREVHAAGATVIAGRSHEQELVAYQPFVEGLGGYLRAVGPDRVPAGAARELARILPALAAADDAAGAALESDPAGARFRLFEAVATLLSAAAKDAPLTLLLEDVHWAEPSTLLLAGHAVRTLPTARLLVVATVRAGEPLASELAGLFVELRRERRLRQIEVPQLPEDAMRELLAEMLGAEPPPGLAAAIHRRTGGNALYGVELVRHLLEAGAVALADNEMLVAPAVEEAGLPEGVRAVIEHRASKLSELAQRALDYAAALGDEFRLVDLDAVVGAPVEALVEAIDETVASRLVEEEAAGELRFAHALVREAIYSRQTATRRALLHRQIASALATRYGERAGAHLADLAWHYRAAGAEPDLEHAAEYSARAGEWALSQLAYEEAAAHFADALETVEGLEPTAAARARLLLAKGNALLRAGRLREAESSFAAAADEARAAADATLLSEAALGVGGIAVTITSPRETVVALLEEALAGVESPSLRARLLARLAIEVYYEPPVERRERLSADAVAAATVGGDAAALLEALNARHVALWGPDHLEERLRIADELVDRARAAGDREKELQGQNWRVLDLVELGELDEARAAIGAHELLAAELRLPAYRWHGPLWRSMLARLVGDLEQAERLTREGAALGELAEDENAAVLVDVQRSGSAFHRGELGTELLELVERRAAGPAGVAWRVALASSYAHIGRLEEAATELARVTATPDELPRDANWLYTLSAMGQVVGLVGDTARAGPLYGLLLPYAERLVCSGRASDIDASSSYSLGLLARTLGLLDDAESHLEAALRHLAPLGAAPAIARTQLRLAELLERRNAGGDAGRAAELRGRALDTARQLGMRGLAVQALRRPE